MEGVVTLGEVPWSREDLREALEEFSALYEARPIKDNLGGMRAPHAFLAWFALRALHPRAVVESGIWLGQGTWLIEQACPEAQLYCIDPNLDRIRYRSARARYFDRDFATLDWSPLPPHETVLLFDDHRNALDRVRAAKAMGFRHLLFEDNYPPSRGDCYSLKQALDPRAPRSLSARLQRGVRALLGQERGSTELREDARYLRETLVTYYEFPPIFKPERTRWGDTWEDEHYPTPDPLLSSVEATYQQRYWDEATDYTWICYARLR